MVRTALETTGRRWHRQNVARRIWKADPGVWSGKPVPELTDRLGWLDLHETMRPRLDELTRLADQVADGVAGAGTDDVVLLGMGGSSLAPELFAEVFGSAPGRPRLSVLDSTHPAAVEAVSGRIDPNRTVFIVSSKSGTTLETLSFFRHFWRLTGGDGSRFISITDPETPLVTLAGERGFRAVVEAPTEVGGRYSALTPFGLLPAAIIGIDLSRLLDKTAELADRDSGDFGEGIAGLGALWGAQTMVGRDKLTVLTSPGLAALGGWLEQLIAESLGKDGTGVVPVAGEPHGPVEVYGTDRAFVAYRLAGEPVPPGLNDLAAAGHPVTTVELDNRYALGAELLRAEVATAAAAEVLGVHPFDQPDVEDAKRLTRRAMDEPDGDDEHPPQGGEAAVRVFAELVAGMGEGDYLGIQAYLAPSPATAGEIASLRVAVRTRTGCATTAGWGPRFLHSTGQLHKGGPASGCFLQLVDRPARDVPIPETDHGFARVIASQAAGDHSALIAAGRRVVRVAVAPDTIGALVAALGEK